MRSVLGLLMILGLALAGRAGAQTALVPDAPVTRLDEIGVYAVGYAYRGHKEQQFPNGSSLCFDEATGVWCQPAGTQQGKKAFLLHCPWRNGTGIAFQQFVFKLPKAKRVLLRGSTAMRADIVGKSDGATFRVYVSGRKLLEANRRFSTWQPFQLDLTSYAGKTATIRFETDPGPRNDCGWDFSLWGDRELVLEGFVPKRIAQPDPPPLPLDKLCSTQTGTVAPISGFAGENTVEVRGETAILRYRGPDGTLEYSWRRPQTARDPLYGPLVLKATVHGGSPVEVPLAGDASLEWLRSAVTNPKNTRWTREPDGVRLARVFNVGSSVATLYIKGKLIGKSLVFELSCDRPLIRALNIGTWGPVARRQSLNVPFYSDSAGYLPAENLFTNAYPDWTRSTASAHEKTLARYDALTNGSRNCLSEQVIFSAAWHLAEVFPNISNPASPYRKELGNRLVLDIWGGSFGEIARNLEKLADYGIRDGVAIIHDWQRSGYDNALPNHYPAAANRGGDEAMKALVETGAGLGYRMALHENYVDYYPNYDAFNANDIALSPDGKRMNAWFNPGTKIQSFAVKPAAIPRLAMSQSPEIHRRYNTNADYLDVHSAVPPWFHVDARAGEPGAGTFRKVWDAHRNLWEYERKTHGGPVFGEGGSHWYWSGCLDGVEAQFGWGTWANQGMIAPLMVDFDLLKVHPLQLNHGMGYYERWWEKSTWGSIPPMVVLDQYRMQEVAFGHAGFLGATTWSNLPLAWLENHLLTPVTARYAEAKPAGISYCVNGKWVDGTHAARAGDWNQVRVRYDNGLTITANNAKTSLAAGRVLLPRFGWLAEGAGVTAYTALRDGVLVDYAETADSFFANARNATDWNNSGICAIRPQVERFEQTAPRTFRVTYKWQVKTAPGRDYQCFVHFDGPGGNGGSTAPIRFQQDHALALPTSRWESGAEVRDGEYTVVIPKDLRDGDYPWLIGLFVADTGRIGLLGVEDGAGRIRLGTLFVREGGRKLFFDAERGVGEDRRSLFSQHLNTAGKVIDFGSLRTDGSARIRRVGKEWVLQTLPRERSFTLELSVARFAKPASIRSIGGAGDLITPEAKGAWWRIPLNGAKEYRWPVE